MRRQAEDLLISDTSSQKGKDTLTFIVTLAKARSDLENFKKGWVFYIITTTTITMTSAGTGLGIILILIFVVIVIVIVHSHHYHHLHGA